MLTLFVLSLFVQEPPAGPMREIEETRRDVDFLREINRLELTRDQLAGVVRAIEEGAKRGEEIAASRKKEIDALIAALAKLRDRLAKGEKVGPEDEQEVGEAQMELGEIMQDVERVHEKTTAAIKGLLNEKQWKRIQALGRPDPVRHLRESFARLVQHVKEDPLMDPAEPIRENLGHMARPLGLSDDDVFAEAERIGKLVDDASVDVEFESKQEDYLRKAFEEGKLGEAAKRMAPPPEEGGRRIGQFLSAPRTLKALRLRLENMK